MLIANPRKTRLIYGEKRKTDKLDAQKLARLARVDPELLYPVKHRGARSRAHLALIHSRDVLIRSRTQLINHVRGTVKSLGARVPKCSAQSFHKKVAGQPPDDLAESLEDIVATIASLTERIRNYDRRIELLPTGDRVAQAGSWSGGTDIPCLRHDPGGIRHRLGRQFPARRGGSLHKPHPLRIGFADVFGHMWTM